MELIPAVTWLMMWHVPCVLLAACLKFDVDRREGQKFILSIVWKL